MKKITIRKPNLEKTFNVNYAWAPTYNGHCQLEMEDDRLISEIGVEFEGLSEIVYETDSTERPYVFEGYNKLQLIERLNGGAVLIELEKT